MHARTTPREPPTRRRIFNLFPTFSRSSGAAQQPIHMEINSPTHPSPIVPHESAPPLAPSLRIGDIPTPHPNLNNYPVPLTSTSRANQPENLSPSPPNYLPTVYDHTIEQAISSLRVLRQHMLLAHCIDSQKFKDIETGLGNVESGVSNVESRLGNFEAELTQVRTDLAKIQTEMQLSNQKKAMEEARHQNRRRQPLLSPVPGPHGEDIPANIAFPGQMIDFFRPDANIEAICNFYALEFNKSTYQLFIESVFRLLRHLGLDV